MVLDLNGRTLAYMTHQTETLTLLISGNHHEADAIIFDPVIFHPCNFWFSLASLSQPSDRAGDRFPDRLTSPVTNAVSALPCHLHRRVPAPHRLQ